MEKFAQGAPPMFQEVPETTLPPQPEPQEAQAEAAPEVQLPDQKLEFEKIIDETVRRQQQTIISDRQKFEWNQRLAKMFVESGTFADVKAGGAQGIAQAMVKIMLGESMGLLPIEAMQSIYFVYGRPVLDAQVRAARMKRYGYSWQIVEHTPKVCRIVPYYKGQPIKSVEISFTIEEAQKAGLIKKDGGWEKYPMDMLFARAITRMQRRYAPEVLNGANILDRTEAMEVDEPLPGNAKAPVFRKEESAA